MVPARVGGSGPHKQKSRRLSAAAPDAIGSSRFQWLAAAPTTYFAHRRHVRSRRLPLPGEK